MNWKKTICFTAAICLSASHSIYLNTNIAKASTKTMWQVMDDYRALANTLVSQSQSIIQGTSNNDTLSGTICNDVIYGYDENDIISGGDGNDVIYGNKGDDILQGNKENDIIFGGQANDTLYGGQGDDALFGDLGSDILYGNKGNDMLFGGEGNDTYVYALGEGEDVIFDESGNDTLVFSDIPKSQAIHTRVGNDLIITVPQGKVTIKEHYNGHAIENFQYAAEPQIIFNVDPTSSIKAGSTLRIQGKTSAHITQVTATLDGYSFGTVPVNNGQFSLSPIIYSPGNSRVLKVQGLNQSGAMIREVTRTITVSSATTTPKQIHTLLYEYVQNTNNQKSIFEEAKRLNNGIQQNTCAFYASEALRRIGVNIPKTVSLTDGYTSERNVGMSLTYELLKQGWKISTNPNYLQPGDIVFSTDEPGYEGVSPAHVYIFMKWKTPGKTDYAYIVDNQVYIYGNHYHERNVTASGPASPFAYFMYKPSDISGTVPTINDVPYYNQNANRNEGWRACNITSLAMVTDYYGITDPNKLGMRTPDYIYNTYGLTFTVDGLVYRFNELAKRVNSPLRARGTTRGTFTELRNLASKGQPLIVHGDFTRSGHIAVVIGYDGTHYTVHDPYGVWNLRTPGSYDTSKSGKAVKYPRAAFEYALSPIGNGDLWYTFIQ